MRRRVKLAFMVNDSARKITYTKRKKSLIKKIDELATLCGIEACAIVYSDFHSEPEIWPSPWEVQRVVTKFRSYSDFEKGKKMLNQESFLIQRIGKSREQLAKLEKHNWEVEKSLILSQCLVKENFIDTLNPNALNDLAFDINEMLEKITSKVNELDTNETT
ncbi:unnamed protein product [Vicia faba]|uniref:MADS-box domain-containing protein n=1 Tax=Vicia faba TaxID=3906 RepID=A0AAV0ZJI2_VICFA|nr:unnamed protein product [Vicia faba]